MAKRKKRKLNFEPGYIKLAWIDNNFNRGS